MNNFNLSKYFNKFKFFSETQKVIDEKRIVMSDLNIYDYNEIYEIGEGKNKNISSNQSRCDTSGEVCGLLNYYNNFNNYNKKTILSVQVPNALLDIILDKYSQFIPNEKIVIFISWNNVPPGNNSYGSDIIISENYYSSFDVSMEVKKWEEINIIIKIPKVDVIISNFITFIREKFKIAADRKITAADLEIALDSISTFEYFTRELEKHLEIHPNNYDSSRSSSNGISFIKEKLSSEQSSDDKILFFDKFKKFIEFIKEYKL
jgi:hypothetical protein